MIQPSPRIRLLTLCGLLLVLLYPRSSRAERWWSEDKAPHFGLSFALAGGVYAALWGLSERPPQLRAALAGGLSLLPGLAKELCDATQPENAFSAADLVYDGAGALAGALCGWLIEELLTPQLPARLVLLPRPAAALLGLDVSW